VLVARGACGNPWIFRDLRASEAGREMPGAPSRDEWMETVMRHVRLQIEHRVRQRDAEDPVASEGHAVRELRKHLLWYTRGLKGGVHFRRDATSVATSSEVEGMLERHFPPGAPFRFDPSLAAGEAVAE
jgi:tRNA-dihydrouridine synthase B